MSSKAPEPPKLDELNQAYEVIGELAGRADAKQLIAKRREDGVEVIIAIFETPAGDQGNALSHLAADANRLQAVQNPGLVPVLDSRWVGTDAFAIVTRRLGAPSLEEVLSRREEDFSYARIAAILRELNAVVEWAREKKFMHRAVALDTVYVEPGSDRVLVSFAVRALPRTGMPGPAQDARNIALVARAMLTRSPVAPERDGQPLAELRPGLPKSVLQETEALLTPDNGAEAPDVTGFISRLAMAEDLKRGEMHLEKSRNAIKEAHRKAKEQIESARLAHEQQLAAERKEHERLVAEQARKFAKERADFEAELEKQRQALVRERETLANERAEHARDSEALGKERAAHKRDCEAFSRERAAHREEAAALAAQLADHRRLMVEERKRLTAQIEAQQQQAAAERKEQLARFEAQQREAADERKQIAAQLAALQRQTVEERKHAALQLAARLEEQKRVAAEEKKRLADQLALEKRQATEERKRLEQEFAASQRAADEERERGRALRAAAMETAAASAASAAYAASSQESHTAAPVPPTPKPQKPLPKPPKPAGPARAGARFRWNRIWNVPAAAIAVLIALAGITFAASNARRDDGPERPAASTTALPPSTATPSSTAPNVVIVDSLAGGVVPIDSTRATITTRPRPRLTEERPPVIETPVPVRADTTPTRRVPPVSAFDLMGVSPIPLREGNARLDSIARPPARDTLRREPRRDSVPRIDSLPRPDSLRTR
jgi:hypothetical protein